MIDTPKSAAKPTPLDTLSEREREILRGVARGTTNQRLADDLSLSVKTVSTYRSRVLDKMGLASNSDLTYYALKNGLIQ